MHLKFRNLSEAFRKLVRLFHEGLLERDGEMLSPDITRQPSRNGNVLKIEEPVTITYSHPTERVLLNPARDCNPASLLYEALWMLAGRNDVAPLAYYTPKFKEFSDDGITLNGAYGYRWRKAKYVHRDYPMSNKEVDQLDLIVNHLKAEPNSRRAVLSMWNVEDDLLKIGKPIEHPDLGKVDYTDYSLDVCCNLNVMFSLRYDPDEGPPCTCGADRTGPSAEAHKEDCPADEPRTVRPRTRLDMTVTNRSNDMILGLLNANYCLSGSTRLASPEGDTDLHTLAIGFSSGRLSRFPVYSFNPTTKDLRISWCTNVWKTGTRKVIELGFDDGTSITLTKNHKLFRKIYNDSVYCEETEAGKLRVGDRVWAGGVWKSKSGRWTMSYRLGSDTGYGNHQAVSRAYWGMINGTIPKGFDIHHRNENKSDDRITNLEMLRKSDHARHHASNRKYSKEVREIMSKGRKRYFASLTEEERQQYAKERTGWEMSEKSRSRLGVSLKEFWNNQTEEHKKEHGDKIRRGQIGTNQPRFSGRKHTQETKAKMAEARRKFWERKRGETNHKIVYIKDAGYEEVFDFTVPGDHNARLDNGVFVHNCTFSFLQEYMAARLGVEVGLYHHFTNNLHVYDWNWKPEEWLAAEKVADKFTRNCYETMEQVNNAGNYADRVFSLVPLVKDPEQFEKELPVFVEQHAHPDPYRVHVHYKEPFLADVADPLLKAFHSRKSPGWDSWRVWVKHIKASDWAMAMENWCGRRETRKSVRN